MKGAPELELVSVYIYLCMYVCISLALVEALAAYFLALASFHLCSFVRLHVSFICRQDFEREDKRP